MNHTSCFHIVLLTRNRNDSVRRVIDAACATVARYSDVVLTVADGGNDSTLRDWIKDRGYHDVRYQAAECMRKRVVMALALPSAWTLFLSDDDPFTIDYLDLLVAGARRAERAVAVVAPSHYLAFDGGYLTGTRTSPSILDETPAARLFSMFKARETTGALFYAAIRSEVVNRWSEFLAERPFVPGYSDQLLTALAAVSGNVTPSELPIVLARDESNWNTPERTIRSDASLYPSPDMSFLHELFWVADLVELLSKACDLESVGPAIRHRACEIVPLIYIQLQFRIQVLGRQPSRLVIDALEAAAAPIERLLQHDGGPLLRQALMDLHAVARTAEQHLLVTRAAA